MNVNGTTGNDNLAGSPQADNFFMREGNDYAAGGAGDDAFYTNQGADTVLGGAGNDSAFGGADADNDTFVMGSGDDLVFGGGGNDNVQMGEGNDVTFGGAGSDTLYGGAGNDEVGGGAGNDLIYDAAGVDTIYGGDGVDRAVFEGSRSDYVINENPDGTFNIYDKAAGQANTVYSVEEFQFGDGVFNQDNVVPTGGGGGGTGYPKETVRFGDANEDVQRPDGTMPYGTGVGAENFENVRYEDRADTNGVSLEAGQKVHFRGGADILPDSIDPNGDFDVTVPTGADPTNANRAAWNIDRYLNPNADGGAGHTLGTDAGDLRPHLTITHVESGKVAEFDWNEGGAGDGFYSHNGTPVLGDETLDGFDADSINPAFFRNALGDIDPNTAGDQLYNFGEATFEIEYSAEVVGVIPALDRLVFDQEVTVHVEAPVAALDFA